MKKVEIINNKYFKAIETFLKINFEKFEILEANYKSGKSHNFDGIIGYIDKPGLNLIVMANEEKYNFNFYLDSNFIGDYWYWIITTFKDGSPKRSTCYFDDFNHERIRAKAEEYKPLLNNYIIK